MNKNMQRIKKLIIIVILITSFAAGFAQNVKPRNKKYSTPKPRHNMIIIRKKTDVNFNRYSTKIDFDKKLKKPSKLLN